MEALTITSSGQLVERRAATLEELAERWASYIDVKPKSKATYNRAIKQFITYLRGLGVTAPEQAKRDNILSYREKLQAEGKKPTTIQAYIIAIKLFCRWLVQEGTLPFDISEHIKGAKLDSSFKKDYLIEAQVKELLGSIDRSTLQGKRDFAILALMTTTGLRTIEVVRANIEDMRAAGNSIALYIQGKGHEEKALYVKLAQPVEAAIREYLAARKERDSREPLFSSIAHRNSGERMTTRSISRIVKESLRAAGLDSDKLTAHSLRHTAGTLNLLAGGSLEETQQLLRHKNINTTLIYVHALERAKNNSEERIANVIFN